MSKHRLEPAADFSEIRVEYPTTGESTNIHFQSQADRAAAWTAGQYEAKHVLKALMGVETTGFTPLSGILDKSVVIGFASEKPQPQKHYPGYYEDDTMNTPERRERDAQTYATLAAKDYQLVYQHSIDGHAIYKEYYKPYLFTHHGETPTGAYLDSTVPTFMPTEWPSFDEDRDFPPALGRHHLVNA